MKTLLVIIDGLGDEPLEQFEQKTPWQIAYLPGIKSLAQQGQQGVIDLCQGDFAPDSMKCILRLLAVEPEDFPANRSYLELFASEEKLSKDETVWRCNLVQVDRHRKLLAFNGKGLTDAAMRDAAFLIAQTQYKLKLLHLSAYRNLLVVKNAKPLDIKPPHESLGENVDDLLKPLMEHCRVLKGFVKSSEDKLKYLQNEKNAYYMFYPWGAAQKHITESFALRQGGREGAVVAAAEIMRGIGKYLQMEVPKLPEATGDTDTVITSKFSKTLELLQKYDFVLTHFNGCDEAAHRKNPTEKVKFLEQLDKDFFSPLAACYKGPLKLLVIGDHITSSLTGMHKVGAVPFVTAILNAALPVNTLQNYHDIWNFLYEGE